MWQAWLATLGCSFETRKEQAGGRNTHTVGRRPWDEGSSSSSSSSSESWPVIALAIGQGGFRSWDDNTGALITRIEFWGPLYYTCNKEPKNSIGDFKAPILQGSFGVSTHTLALGCHGFWSSGLATVTP